VHGLLALGKKEKIQILHSAVVDSWLWGGRASSRRLALDPELEAAHAEDVTSSLPLTKFSTAALQKLTAEEKGKLFPQVSQAYARWFYQRSETGLIVATITAIQHQASFLVTPEASKWPRFVPANLEHLSRKENGVPMRLSLPSKALAALEGALEAPAEH
jgi:hypothetical protein